MEEVAAFLELQPAEVMDTATFYEEYWLRPRAVPHRRLPLALLRDCGSNRLTARLKKKLGIELGETTADGKFTLVEYECLGSCGTAPAALCNEVLHEDLNPDDFANHLDTLPADPHQYKDPTVTWDEGHGHH